MIAYLKDSRTGEETLFKTKLEYFREEDKLIFKFDCENSMLFSAYDKFNEPIYEGDVVEVFVCVGGDRRKYYEFELAPNGTAFFAQITNDVNGLNEKMLPKAFETKVITRENGYYAEIIIPNEAVGASNFSEIVFNAYRIETEGGIPEKNLLALNPTLCGTFHMPQFFVELD